MLKLINKFFCHFQKVKIDLQKKVILGYIVILIIPNVIFGFVYYKQFYSNLQNDYIKSRQQFIEQQVTYLTNNLLRIESAAEMCQSNNSLIEYLSGFPQSEGDYIYSFIKNIQPLTKYIYSSIPDISNIMIYKTNRKVLPISFNISEIPDTRKDFFQNHISKSLDGLWSYNSKDGKFSSVCYDKYLYDSTYYKKVGILEVTVKDQFINDFISKAQNVFSKDTNMFLLDNDGSYCRIDNNLTDIFGTKTIDSILHSDTDSYGKNKAEKLGLIIYKSNLTKFNAKIIVIEDAKGITVENGKSQIWYLLLFFLFTLILITFLYGFIYLMVIQRVVSLTKHMGDVGKDNFAIYQGKSGNDEIGVLIKSFNDLVSRIEILIHQVKITEKLRREAEYKALQAQIKPHFLFGTLETIRMLADINGNMQISDLTYSFGKMMRYTLSGLNSNVYLNEEVENVNYYLKIYKERLENKLEYNVSIETDITACLCPQFILQPLVENSIEHGLRKDGSCIHIQINIFESCGYLVVEIGDNGIGIDGKRLKEIQGLLDGKKDISEFQTKTSGYALYNINERIKMYFGDDCGLKVQSNYGYGMMNILNIRKIIKQD